MAMPGMTTQLYLMATKLGTFKGVSGNISGAGFSGMTFAAKSVSDSDFKSWVAGIQAQSNPLNPDTYSILAKPTEYVAPMYYSSVAPELYTGTSMKYMAPDMNMNMQDVSGMDMSAPQQ